VADCFCGKNAVIFLHYAKKHLCEKHFLKMFDKRFRKTIREFKMLKKGDRVAVGISGGKDSCALLHSLTQLSLPIELVAVTIDEGIKGYREKTLLNAKKECEKLDIEHVVFKFKKEAGLTMDEIVEKDEGIPCSHCGVLRRYLLNKGAREVRATKLATGHNLDDVAQTVMMNIMRNEPSRLARFKDPFIKSSKFVPRIRPFMRTPEKEVAIYAMLKGIELDDKDCPYARFAFRGHVRKMLNETEERYPGTKFRIVNSFLEFEDALRSKYMDTKLTECESCGEISANKLCMFCKRVRMFKEY
jgi:uncharacterized protein (TIGR00269 family)